MTNGTETKSLRPQFLIEIYKEMMADINRHIMVVWQSVGVVLGSFAIMGLVEKRVVSLDYASSLLLIVCTWSLGLLIDASYWYNRNLCIVANIEKIFLEEEDLKNVHYYFGQHRPNNKMITTIRIQFALSLSIGLFNLCYHFYVRVVPWFGFSMKDIDIPRLFPYVITLISGALLICLKNRRNRHYSEFLVNSPGVKININEIKYGDGHGFKKS